MKSHLVSHAFSSTALNTLTRTREDTEIARKRTRDDEAESSGTSFTSSQSDFLSFLILLLDSLRWCDWGYGID